MAPTLTKILYVEDDLDIQSVAKIALEIVGGLTLLSCSSGKEALNPSTIVFAPDLMLLDVMMPEMDGPTTLKHLRSIPSLKNTPVIFMTAKVQVSEVAYYKSLGAIGVIAKPFDPMQLAEQIRQLWNECVSV
ncbi:Response regulator receiver domain [Solimicrobium silvestre]|uniref:Response regulator receiver domain n=2 Tax=Solimicrobium silvestre TaxID=2099400 RepID=A0A2S9H1I1_9BURK|nr:Response regulator receiver domain [Solimicrobium silvestre]